MGGCCFLVAYIPGGSDMVCVLVYFLLDLDVILAGALRGRGKEPKMKRRGEKWRKRNVLTRRGKEESNTHYTR